MSKNEVLTLNEAKTLFQEFVLQQPDAMKVNIIDFPKGFKAKEW